ncbi:MAG: hypothetical protein ACP5EP_04675 [Acidobacteriaceae bacterium]
MGGTRSPASTRAKNIQQRKHKRTLLQNYFNYFTEIEEHFQRRRGSLLLLSTLDWALVATWQEAGLPLEAVLRGIDATFDKYDARKGRARTRKINGLAYCAQEVLRAVEEMHGASVGAHSPAPAAREESGFSAERVAQHLQAAAAQLRTVPVPEAIASTVKEISTRVHTLAQGFFAKKDAAPDSRTLEALEQTLLVLEDKLFAAVFAATPEKDLVALREQSARELAPYRSRLQVAQIRQIEQQFLRRQLFEGLRLPRLSLFYMAQQ